MKKVEKGFMKANTIGDGVHKVAYPEPIGNEPAKDKYTQPEDIGQLLFIIAIFMSVDCGPYILITVITFLAIMIVLKWFNQFSDNNKENDALFWSILLSGSIAVIPVIISLLMLLQVAPEK